MKKINPNKINVFDLEKEYEMEDKFKKYFNTQEKQDIELRYILKNPFQPRVIFDEVKLLELSNSIKTYGIISPILLRKINDEKYEILASEGRVRASELAGLKTIPAIIGMFDDRQMMEVSIIENIQREQLNFIEEARAYENLSNYIGLSHDEIAHKIGKSRSYVSNVMRLLNLPIVIQEYVINGVLTMGQVKPLLTLNEQDALDIANQAIDKGLNSRQIENLCNLLKGRKLKNTKPNNNPYLDYAAALINKKLNTRVKIKDGLIKIYFKDQEDLEAILEKLN